MKRYRCLPPDPPKDEYIPTSADLEKLIAVGITRTKWEVALWSSVLSANSGLGPQEIKLIKLKDIHLGKDPLGCDAGYITVARRCKTIFRYRNQPLNANGYIAVNKLLERLKRLGYGDSFEHYLLPQRLKTASKGEKYDPTQPQGDWHKAWGQMLKASGLPHMRPYILRHVFASNLNRVPGLSDITKKALMGHSATSGLLAKTYTHISQEEKSRAVAHLGYEVAGLMHRNIASKPNGDEVDASLVKLVQSVAVEAMAPFMEEAKRDLIRKAAVAVKSDDKPETPGAYLHPRLNIAQMWAYIDRSHIDGCWVWIGPMQGNGRVGALWTGGKNGVARRIVYELCTADPLPDDTVRLYPTCRTPHCVNPEHMQVGVRPGWMCKKAMP